MEIFIFPGDFILRSLRVRKRALKHMFKIFEQRNLSVVFIVDSIQHFYARLSEVDMRFRTICLTVAGKRHKNLSTADLERALNAVNGQAYQAVLISDKTGDERSAKQAKIRFVPAVKAFSGEENFENIIKFGYRSNKKSINQ